MQIPFRQGIVQCSHNFSNQPNFLKLLGGDVYVDTTIGPLLVSFSQGPSEYLMREQDNTQIQAFIGPFLGTLSYWFYWDLNVITGIKTYGYTNSFPVFGPVAPPSPIVNQHWFNTLTNGMFVWNGTNWVNKIRVFAGNLQNTQVTNEYALIGGNNVQKTFYVTGNITAEFVIGDAITIVGGGLNNGSYNVTAYIFNVGLNRSEITVSQIIPSPIITGFLQHVPTIGLTTGQLVAYDVGSQVGNNTAILSGFIFYDQNGVAVKLVNGQFFTTESPFISATGQTQPLKLEDSFTFGNVTQNMAAYQVVSVDSLDPTKLNSATYEDTSIKVLGIILNNALIGQQALTVLQGVVDNPNWTWATPNITLWVNNGNLVTIDPFVSDPINHPNKAPPVGRTINSTKIIFDQGLGGLGLQGLQGIPGDQMLASTTQLGSVYLTLNPVVTAIPLAVGDNDPRMSDPRTPLPHNQAATTITMTPVAPVIPLPTDVQDGFVSMVAALVAKVNRSGDSMTGSLVFPTTVGITVTGLPNPLLASDAVPLGFLVSSLSSYLPLSGGIMTGVLVHPVGSAAVPAITFLGDLSTGFYHSGANEVSVAIAGTQKVLFSAAGVTVFSGFFTPGTGTAADPEFAFTNDPTTGMYRVAAGEVGIASGGVNVVTFTATGMFVAGNIAATGGLSVTGPATADLDMGGFKITDMGAPILAGDAATKEYVDDYVASFIPLTTKGDLLVHNGTVTLQRLGVGDTGDVLAANSAAAVGLNWIKRPYINVKDAPYNAVGDGIADDSAAIQAASDDAANNVPLYFPDGTYLCESHIVLTVAHTYLTWLGAGLGAIIKKGFNGDLVTMNNTYGFSTDNITYDGSHGTFTGKGFVNTGASGHYPFFGANVLFKAFTDTAIEFGSDAGFNAKVMSNFYPGAGQTDYRAIHCVGPDTFAVERLFSGCIIPVGYIDLDGALATHFIGVQCHRVEIDANCSVTTVNGGTWASDGVAPINIDGQNNAIIGLRVAGDITLMLGSSGTFIGNTQTGGTFTNNSFGWDVVHHDINDAGRSWYGKTKIYNQPSGLESILTSRVAFLSDADATSQVGSAAQTIIFTNPVAANRAITLSTIGALAGNRFRYVRTNAATGTFIINVGGLFSLRQNEWCEVEYDSTTWRLINRGYVDRGNEQVDGTFGVTGVVTFDTALGIASGGTGASTDADARTNLGLAIGTNVQAYDSDLAALAATASAGMYTVTGVGTSAVRTITGTANQITVTNGDGVSANPTLSIPNTFTVPDDLTVTDRSVLTGLVGIGTSSLNAFDKVTIGGTLPTSSSFTQAININGTIPAATTIAYGGFISGPSTEAAAFTCANINHFSASDVVLGGGSSVTTQRGYQVAAMVSGTNIRGFEGNIASGANRYNLYMVGTADNYLAGSVGVGVVVSASAKINVGGTLPTSGTNTQGINNAGVIPAGTTSTALNFNSAPSTAVAAFTLNTLNHFRATDVSLGAGSAVTFQYGYVAQDLTSAASQNIGFLSFQNSGTSRWAFYSAGTATSIFTGKVILGGSSESNVFKMALQGSSTGDTTTRGFMNNQTIASDVTSIYAGYHSIVNTAAAAFTLGELSNFYISNASLGAGSAITIQAGIHITDLTSGASNYGVWSQLTSGSNKWNIYASGTAANYLEGSTGIGTSSLNASAKLQVDSTTLGFLPPRMTTAQKNAISSPLEGLIVYDTDLHKLCVRTAAAWETITSV